MKLVFMGTPIFAATGLEALLSAGHQISGVVTQPDRPRGRGQKIEFSPVKTMALAAKIPVFQPESLKNNTEILEILQKINPELIIVVAYGLFLPAEILILPKFGCLNVHASLLPKYRGAAPIQTAILNGEKSTGISLFIINEKMDAGDIIAEKETEITPEETAGELEIRLAKIGARLLVETIPGFETGTITKTPQDNKPEKPTFAPLIKKEDGLINWSDPAEKIHNKIRAFNPRPGAFSYLHGKYIKILNSRLETPVAGPSSPEPPGKILKISRPATLVATGLGELNLREVQIEGGRPLNPQALALGRQMKAGDCLGRQ